MQIYSQGESRARLTCYVLIAAFTTISSEIEHSDFSNYSWKHFIMSLCTLVVSITTAWRAYLDQTVTMIDPQKKDDSWIDRAMDCCTQHFTKDKQLPRS